MEFRIEDGFSDNRTHQLVFIHNTQGILCKLMGSPTCCGVYEFGYFRIGDITQEIKDAIKNAFPSALTNKGVIYSYLPKHLSGESVKWMKVWREILLLLGFQEEKEFYNPNSGNTVIQYSFNPYKDSE